MKELKKKVVIFLHCFFDSPHVYRNMLYSDFYEWIGDTLKVASEVSKQGKIDFYVKPHPNGIEGNDEIVEQLKVQFPAIHFINKNVSNKQPQEGN